MSGPDLYPLTGLDSAFLAVGTGANLVNVAAVMVLDPPEGRRSLFSATTRFAQVRQMVGQRIHLAPQLRQRAVPVTLGLSHHVLVDDPDFDLDNHLRRASLPHPGGSRELDQLVADIMSQPLDLDQPLWEMVIVEGLSGGRVAVVAKVHHAILDGVSGANLLAAFFDFGPRPRPVPEARPWAPSPVPSQWRLVGRSATALVRRPSLAWNAAQRGLGAAADLELVRRLLGSDPAPDAPPPLAAPRTSLNGTVSPRRRFASLVMPFGEIQSVRRAFDCTVNDVVLTIVSGALRRYLALRGEPVSESLVALVPVSTRKDDERGDLGNKVAGMLVSLSSAVEQPVDRLVAIAEQTIAAKRRHQGSGGRLLEDFAQVFPPAVTGRLSRWVTGARLFDHVPPLCNVVVSGIPGPGVALWCAGSRVRELYLVGPVALGVGLNVTTVTYDGQLHVAVLGCRRLVPEVQDLAIMLDDAREDLVALATERRRAG